VPGSLDDPLSAEASQVVAGLGGAVRSGCGAGQIGDEGAQVVVAEAVEQVSEDGEGQHEGHHPGVAESQARRLLTVVGDGRLHHPLDAVGGQTRVLADTLDLEEAPVTARPVRPAPETSAAAGGAGQLVDVATELLEVGEVRQTFVEGEAARIAERGLGSQPAAFLEVLLQVGAAVLDVELGRTPS